MYTVHDINIELLIKSTDIIIKTCYNVHNTLILTLDYYMFFHRHFVI